MKRYCLFLTILATGCGQSHTSIVFPAGGYPYPAKISAGDSNYYHLPIKNQIPRRDSFLYEDIQLFYKAFDEPNISLGPQAAPVFRLVCSFALDYTTMIILKENEMVIKKGISGEEGPILHDSLLTETERRHFRLLKWYYPFDTDTANITPVRRRYVDSMINIYPQLLNPAYYRYLIDKTGSGKRPPFIYTTKIIPLSPAQYTRLVNAINRTGYWKLPWKLPCPSPAMDGYGFSLEANTSRRYNMVEFGSCGYETPFTEVCFELYIFAKNIN